VKLLAVSVIIMFLKFKESNIYFFCNKFKKSFTCDFIRAPLGNESKMVLPYISEHIARGSIERRWSSSPRRQWWCRSRCFAGPSSSDIRTLHSVRKKSYHVTVLFMLTLFYVLSCFCHSYLYSNANKK